MDNIDKRLDEILNSLVNQVEWCVNPSAGAISVNREKEQTAQKQAKQAIKQLVASEFEKMIFEIDNPRSIDKGNEAYYDQAESFRLGYNLSIAMLRQKLEEWKK